LKILFITKLNEDLTFIFTQENLVIIFELKYWLKLVLLPFKILIKDFLNSHKDKINVNKITPIKGRPTLIIKEINENR
jgi:hypothetical protein